MGAALSFDAAPPLVERYTLKAISAGSVPSSRHPTYTVLSLARTATTPRPRCSITYWACAGRERRRLALTAMIAATRCAIGMAMTHGILPWIESPVGRELRVTGAIALDADPIADRAPHGTRVFADHVFDGTQIARITYSTGRGLRGSRIRRDADCADHVSDGTRIARITYSTGRGLRGSRTRRDADCADHALDGTRVARITLDGTRLRGSHSTGRGLRGSR